MSHEQFEEGMSANGLGRDGRMSRRALGELQWTRLAGSADEKVRKHMEHRRGIGTGEHVSTSQHGIGNRGTAWRRWLLLVVGHDARLATWRARHKDSMWHVVISEHQRQGARARERGSWTHCGPWATLKSLRLLPCIMGVGGGGFVAL